MSSGPRILHPTPDPVMLEVSVCGASSVTGTDLQKLLDQHDMSQRGTARELDINERTMRSYVAGDLPVPRVVELAVRYLAGHRPECARKGCTESPKTGSRFCGEHARENESRKGRL